MPGDFLKQCKSLVAEAIAIYVPLLKILVPAVIVVKLMQQAGVIDLLSDALAPLMAVIGLPSVLSLVWATTLFTNILTGMVVFFNVAANEPMTVAQATTLGVLLLLSHSIPVEGAIAKRLGYPWWLTIVLRVGGGFLLAWLMHLFYSASGTLQEQAVLVWQPQQSGDQWFDWVTSQVQMLLSVFLIILCLVTLLKIIAYIGVEKILHKIMRPMLKLAGVKESAGNSIIVGLTLGLTFGAGLLIRDVDSGRLDSEDMLVVMSFLAICHGLIDDTIVVMLFGAHLSGIIFARIAFALLVVGILSRLLRHKSRLNN